VSAALDAGIPETKARMIRLEARQAAMAGTPEAPAGAAAPAVYSLLILPQPNEKFTVLCENHELANALENDTTLGVTLKQPVSFDRAGYHLIFRGVQIYDPARPLYDYIALKINP